GTPSALSVWNASVAGDRSGSASSTTQPSCLKIFRWRSSTAVTAGSTGSPPRSRLQATRTFLKLRLSGRLNSVPGSAMETGERGSGPAIAESRNAVSSTVRPIGPAVDNVCQPFTAGQLGTRPGVGQPLDDGVVLGRHVVHVDRRAEGGADAFGRDQVLVGDRQARKRRRRFLPVERFRRLQRLLGKEGDDGVDLRVHALDLRDE